MKCHTQTCLARGLRKHEGWCPLCYYALTAGFDRNRRDAESMSMQQREPRDFLVAQLPADCALAAWCTKLGKKAYGVYRATDRTALEADGYLVCEVYSRGKRIEQTEHAP